MKRLFDLIVSAMLIILFIIPMILVAIGVFLRMGSPIMFNQKRPGLNGRPFYIYKFRTMTDDRDEQNQLLPNKQRITPFGKMLRKTSLDELPQLFNVLKGELSLVGPRPLLMEYLPIYTKEQARRHDVKPGMTGWAQVNGRNNISWDERFELDIWYVDHQSFQLDMKILYLTFIQVFRGKDTKPQGKEFIDKYKGNSHDQS